MIIFDMIVDIYLLGYKFLLFDGSKCEFLKLKKDVE